MNMRDDRTSVSIATRPMDSEIGGHAGFSFVFYFISGGRVACPQAEFVFGTKLKESNDMCWWWWREALMGMPVRLDIRGRRKTSHCTSGDFGAYKTHALGRLWKREGGTCVPFFETHPH